jgi:hypothetical protein
MRRIYWLSECTPSQMETKMKTNTQPKRNQAALGAIALTTVMTISAWANDFSARAQIHIKQTVPQNEIKVFGTQKKISTKNPTSNLKPNFKIEASKIEHPDLRNSMKKLEESLGGSDGGGGGLIDAEKVSIEQIIESAAESKTVIKFFANHIIASQVSWKNMTEDEKQKNTSLKALIPSYNKILSHVEVGLNTSKVQNDYEWFLANHVIEVTTSGNCKDAYGQEVHGSIHASQSGRICLSGPLLASKLDHMLYREQIAALIVHEMAHLRGANEEEARILQKAFMSYLRHSPLASLQKTMIKLNSAAESMGFLYQNLIQINKTNPADPHGPANCDSGNLNDLNTLISSGMAYQNLENEGFMILSRAEVQKWLQLEFQLERLMTYACTQSDKIGFFERRKFQEKLEFGKNEFGNFRDYNFQRIYKAIPYFREFYNPSLKAIKNSEEVENLARNADRWLHDLSTKLRQNLSEMSFDKFEVINR